MRSILSESIHTSICTMNNALALALEREWANETRDYDALIVDDGTATAALLDAPVSAGEALCKKMHGWILGGGIFT